MRLEENEYVRAVDATFWASVDQNGPVLPGMTTPCWLWQKATNEKGYGVVSRSVRGVRRTFLAHRYAWMLEHGSFPASPLLHACDNGLCVRHTREGTRVENNVEMAEKGRIVAPGEHPMRAIHKRVQEALARHYAAEVQS